MLELINIHKRFSNLQVLKGLTLKVAAGEMVSVIGKSGAGKSYTVTLEILRQVMVGTEVIVLDPEQEYKDLSDAVGGEYINFTFGSDAKINPFDLSSLYKEGENELGQKIISLHGLLKIMLGEMTSRQEAILDISPTASLNLI